jgi:hypothetical protein
MRELMTGNVPGKIREQQQLKNVDARNISIQKQIDNGERKKGIRNKNKDSIPLDGV